MMGVPKDLDAFRLSELQDVVQKSGAEYQRRSAMGEWMLARTIRVHSSAHKSNFPGGKTNFPMPVKCQACGEKSRADDCPYCGAPMK